MALKPVESGKFIDYIVNCYGALHIMGGLAIAEDIDSLIASEKNH